MDNKLTFHSTESCNMFDMFDMFHMFDNGSLTWGAGRDVILDVTIFRVLTKECFTGMWFTRGFLSLPLPLNTV